MTELEMEEQKQMLVRELIAMAKKEKVTLLYGAKDKECNHAVVLCNFLTYFSREVSLPLNGVKEEDELGGF